MGETPLLSLDLIPNAVSLISPKTPGALRGKMSRTEYPTDVEAVSAGELILPAAELIPLLVSSLSLC